eukprot:725769-Amphidinium_carterae.2
MLLRAPWLFALILLRLFLTTSKQEEERGGDSTALARCCFMGPLTGRPQGLCFNEVWTLDSHVLATQYAPAGLATACCLDLPPYVAAVHHSYATRIDIDRDGAVYMHLLEESDVKHQQQLEKFETMEELRTPAT